MALLDEDLTRIIIGAFYEVYNVLGPGLLEMLYSRALTIELRERGLLIEEEHPVEVVYKGRRIGMQRVDLLVERRLVIEIKSTTNLPHGAKRQLRCYLRTLNLDLGLLLHFGPKAEFYRELAGR